MRDVRCNLMCGALCVALLGLTAGAQADTYNFEPPADLSSWYSIDNNGTTWIDDDIANPAEGSIVAGGHGGGMCLDGGRGSSPENRIALPDIAEGQVLTISLMVRPSDWEGATIALVGEGSNTRTNEATIRFDQNEISYPGTSNSRWCSYLHFSSQQAYGTHWYTILEDSMDPVWSNKGDVLFSSSQWYQVGFTIDTVNDRIIASASGGLVPGGTITQEMELRNNDKHLCLYGITDVWATPNAVLYDSVAVVIPEPATLGTLVLAGLFAGLRRRR